MKQSTDTLILPEHQKTKNINTGLEKLEDHVRIGISVDCVIFGFDENELKVLLIKCDLKKYEGMWSLLGDLVSSIEDVDQAAYRILQERTGMDDVYLEQVRTFGQVGRHPAARVITIVYCSLINVQHHKLGISDNELNWHKISTLKEMAFDHKQILDVCYAWLQKESRNTPWDLAFSPRNSHYGNYRICTRLFLMPS